MNFLQSFEDFLELNENFLPGAVSLFPPGFQDGRIPVYNDFKVKNFSNIKPEALLKPSQVITACQILLQQKTDGVIDQILLTADVSTQGKNTAPYLVDEIAIERKRLKTKLLSRYGGRIEASDYPTTACEKCAGTGKILIGEEETICPNCKGKGETREEPQKTDIFVDVEYILTGIELVDGKELLVGLPISKNDKIKRDKGLESYYKTFIYPDKVLEISFDPY